MRHQLGCGVSLILLGALTLALATMARGGPLPWVASAAIAIALALVLGAQHTH